MKQRSKPFVLFNRWLDWPTRIFLSRFLFIAVLGAGSVMGFESAGENASVFAESLVSGWVWVFFILVGFGGWGWVAAQDAPTADEPVRKNCKKCKTCQARKRERMRGATYDPHEVLRRYPLEVAVDGGLTVEDGTVSMDIDTWRAFWEANAAL